jgi:hypothetical protein
MTGVWLCGVLCTSWSGSRRSRCCFPASARATRISSLPDGWAGQRGAYELSQFIPLAVLIALGRAVLRARRADARKQGKCRSRIRR